MLVIVTIIIYWFLLLNLSGGHLGVEAEAVECSSFIASLLTPTWHIPVGQQYWRECKCPVSSPCSMISPPSIWPHISYLISHIYLISNLYIEHPLLLEYDFCPLSKVWCSSSSPCFNISTILFVKLNSTGIIQYSEKYSTMNNKYTWFEERFYRGVLRQEPILKITEATLIAPMIHLPPVSPASSLQQLRKPLQLHYQISQDSKFFRCDSWD